MKKGDFISVSKRMVKEYYNRYIAGVNGKEKIETGDIIVVEFKDILGDYLIVLTLDTSDGIYYEVTYDKESDKLESMILDRGI